MLFWLHGRTQKRRIHLNLTLESSSTDRHSCDIGTIEEDGGLLGSRWIRLHKYEYANAVCCLGTFRISGGPITGNLTLFKCKCHQPWHYKLRFRLQGWEKIGGKKRKEKKNKVGRRSWRQSAGHKYHWEEVGRGCGSHISLLNPPSLEGINKRGLEWIYKEAEVEAC